jgi:hypothetical protein
MEAAGLSASITKVAVSAALEGSVAAAASDVKIR